jgi:hypothetical protein
MMLSFREYFDFLEEAKKKKEKEFNLSDAKGKLFEILAGSHLHHGTASSGAPNNFLTHYRDEDGKRPEEVHDYIKSEMDKRSPGMYEEINRHSKEAADHMRQHLADLGHREVRETAWTSQTGDHHRFTNEHDANSDADVMVKTNKGPLGVSMKYGSSKNMNLRNNGLEQLENIAGLKPGDLTNLRSEHMKRARDLGIESHEDYKEKAARGDKSAAAADESALSAQREMAKRITKGLADQHAQNGDDFLRKYVAERIAPKTKFQHFRIHTRPLANGEVEHHMGDMQDDIKKLDDFEEFKVAPHDGKSISFRIQGRRKGSEGFETVLDQAIKKGSGPMKGFASTTKAPFLTKKQKSTTPFKSYKEPNPTVSPITKSKPMIQQSTPSITPQESSRLADDGGPSGEHGGYSYHGPGEK